MLTESDHELQALSDFATLEYLKDETEKLVKRYGKGLNIFTFLREMAALDYKAQKLLAGIK